MKGFTITGSIVHSLNFDEGALIQKLPHEKDGKLVTTCDEYTLYMEEIEQPPINYGNY